MYDFNFCETNATLQSSCTLFSLLLQCLGTVPTQGPTLLSIVSIQSLQLHVDEHRDLSRRIPCHQNLKVENSRCSHALYKSLGNNIWNNKSGSHQGIREEIHFVTHGICMTFHDTEWKSLEALPRSEFPKQLWFASTKKLAVRSAMAIKSTRNGSQIYMFQCFTMFDPVSQKLKQHPKIMMPYWFIIVIQFMHKKNNRVVQLQNFLVWGACERSAKPCLVASATKGAACVSNARAIARRWVAACSTVVRNEGLSFGLMFLGLSRELWQYFVKAPKLPGVRQGCPWQGCSIPMPETSVHRAPRHFHHGPSPVAMGASNALCTSVLLGSLLSFGGLATNTSLHMFSVRKNVW